MICENAYYKDDGKLYCKVHDDPTFNDRCPLIYYCTISNRFENIADYADCPYRKGE